MACYHFRSTAALGCCAFCLSSRVHATQLDVDLQFCLCIGIISSIQLFVGRKRLQQMQAMQTAMEEESEDEEEDVNGKPKEWQVVMVDEEQAKVIEGQHQFYPPRRTDLEEERQLRKEYFCGERDSRMDAVFDDTEKNIKIFLSSYFHDKGLIWSEQCVHDAPILIGFFINFIICNHILPEHEKGLWCALSVTVLARNELPATFVIGKALLGDFSAGCEALFSNMSVLVYPDPEELLKDMVGVHNIQVITGEQIKDLERRRTRSVKQATRVGGWGSANNTASDGWGTGSNDQGGDWTTIDIDDDNWQTVGSAWDNGQTPNQLMAFLGPTVFPLTHTAGVMEHSMRYRSKLPKKKAKRSGAKKVEDELEGRFARMVLAPLIVEDATKDATVVSGAGRPHNPFKDEITVLLDPSVAVKMIVGMGLSATWVQLARQDPSGVDWMDEKSADEPKPGSIAGKMWGLEQQEHQPSLIYTARATYHAEGLFGVHLHAQEAWFHFFIASQRRVERDANLLTCSSALDFMICGARVDDNGENKGHHHAICTDLFTQFLREWDLSARRAGKLRIAVGIRLMFCSLTTSMLYLSCAGMRTMSEDSAKVPSPAISWDGYSGNECLGTFNKCGDALLSVLYAWASLIKSTLFCRMMTFLGFMISTGAKCSDVWGLITCTCQFLGQKEYKSHTRVTQHNGLPSPLATGHQRRIGVEMSNYFATWYLTANTFDRYSQELNEGRYALSYNAPANSKLLVHERWLVDSLLTVKPHTRAVSRLVKLRATIIVDSIEDALAEVENWKMLEWE
ncbi:predicted protein [Postia placenta Mad-698-R]|nr:predicted protein [Postia placenta Mad-698-R]